MLAIGSISEAAYGLRQNLLANIADLENDITRVRIGHPGSNLRDLEGEGANGLNLFFYHVDYDGYPADGSSDNPFYVRLYCLITAVGHELRDTSPDNTEGRDISKGENELRLIGEVMTVLHQQPVFPLIDSDDQQLASLQIVPHSITMDTLNHIWGTQGSETPYRLSVAYEVSLAPVPYQLATQSSPLVGDPQMLAWGAMQRAADEEQSGKQSLKPSVEAVEVDTSLDDWVPHIALVETHGDDTRSLHYVFNRTAPLDGLLDIIIAGSEGEDVWFFWSVWRRRDDNSIVAWQEELADSETPTATIEDDDSGLPFTPNIIDPTALDDRRVFQVQLPSDVMLSDTRSWQAVLYVEREWEHESPAGSGEMVTSRIRSNTVLLYGESS